MKNGRIQIKSTIFLTIVIASLFAGLILSLGVPAVKADTSPDIHLGETYHWTLTHFETVSVNNTAQWYDAFFTFKGFYTANVNGILNPDLNFTVTGLNTTIINGTIRIGNASFTNVDQSEIGSNLMLSYYPHYIGLIADTNWSAQTIGFFAAIQANIGNGYAFSVYSVTESPIYIMFRVHQLNNNWSWWGWQNTTLIYAKSSGLLVFADTAFGTNETTSTHYTIGTYFDIFDPTIIEFVITIGTIVIGVALIGIAAILVLRRPEL